MGQATYSTPMMGNRSFVSLFTKSFPSTTTGVTAEAVAASATRVVRIVDVCCRLVLVLLERLVAGHLQKAFCQ